MKKKRTFRKYYYRGVDLDQLLDMSYEQLMTLMGSRARRKFSRGLKRKPLAFMKRYTQRPFIELFQFISVHPIEEGFADINHVLGIEGRLGGDLFNDVWGYKLDFNDVLGGFLKVTP